MKPHEKLVAWRHCHRLVLLTYRFTESFPNSERYGITSQMRRAAASAAANIAEGCARRGNRELRRYLDVSLGALAELEYFAVLARDLGMLSAAQWEAFRRASDEAGRTTMGLYLAVARRATGPSV